MESVAQLAERRNVHPVLFVPIDYAWLDHYPFKVENPDRHRVGTPNLLCPGGGIGRHVSLRS